MKQAPLYFVGKLFEAKLLGGEQFTVAELLGNARGLADGAVAEQVGDGGELTVDVVDLTRGEKAKLLHVAAQSSSGTSAAPMLLTASLPGQGKSAATRGGQTLWQS